METAGLIQDWSISPDLSPTSSRRPEVSPVQPRTKGCLGKRILARSNASQESLQVRHLGDDEVIGCHLVMLQLGHTERNSRAVVVRRSPTPFGRGPVVS
jgi:hypothetical protein